MVGLFDDSTEAEGGSLMGDCATHETMRFETGCALALEAAFDGGRRGSSGDPVPPTKCMGFPP